MKKLKQIAQQIARIKYKKYVVVIIIGVIIVGFLDNNSVVAHLRNKATIIDLRAEKDAYEAEYQRNQAQIHQLQTNPKAMERIARERYLMKRADEDVFILSDDATTAESQKTPEHETTE